MKWLRSLIETAIRESIEETMQEIAIPQEDELVKKMAKASEEKKQELPKDSVEASVELMRGVLNLVGPTDAEHDLLEEMLKQNDDRLLKSAYSFDRDPSLKLLEKYLIRKQEERGTSFSPDWNSLMLARGTVNGIALVFETLRRFSSRYDQMLQEQQLYAQQNQQK